MTKKLYVPVRAQRAAKIALQMLTNEYKSKDKDKYKIVRKPGYRYSLQEVNK